MSDEKRDKGTGLLLEPDDELPNRWALHNLLEHSTQLRDALKVTQDRRNALRLALIEEKDRRRAYASTYRRLFATESPLARKRSR